VHGGALPCGYKSRALCLSLQRDCGTKSSSTRAFYPLRVLFIYTFKFAVNNDDGSQPVTSTFYDDLAALFERLATYSCPDIVCGDFNVHVDVVDDVNTIRLDQLLQPFSNIQNVSEPTHNAGHTTRLGVMWKSRTCLLAT